MRVLFTRKAVITAAAMAICLLPTGVLAQTPDSVRLNELERRIEALTSELERTRLGDEVVEADSSLMGLGPAASKVYKVRQGVSVGGYGEILYENYAADREDGTLSGSVDKTDALRAIVYVGYKFNDRLLINSEIEIEHAKEAYLEFAYLEYRFSDAIGVRAGLLLSPMGLVNELHEPPVFLGTKRPYTENQIIPTTWRENGVGVFGGTESIAYRAYLMTSFNGSGGFSAKGLRGGRQKGAKALSQDFGVVGRLDYVGVPGLLVGASAFRGETAQDQMINGLEVGGRTLIWEVHGDYKSNGVELSVLIAGARVDDVVQLNEIRSLTGSKGIGEDMGGWYVQASYDLLRNTGSEHQIRPYVRYERLNTQRKVPSDFTADPAMDKSILSIGMAWKPVPQVVMKADYNGHSNKAGTGVNQLNVALGYLF